MANLDEMVRLLGHKTSVGGIEWTPGEGGFFGVIGQHAYFLARKSLWGLHTKDILAVHAGDNDRWQVIGSESSGVLGGKPGRIGELIDAILALHEHRAIESALGNLGDKD